MNRRGLVFLALVGVTPLAVVLTAIALLLSAMIGRDFVWRQTDADLASAIEHDSPVAAQVFAAALPNIDTPIPYAHPRVANSRQMNLPPLAIALIHSRKELVQRFLAAGSDPARALGQLSFENASALLTYAIQQQKPLPVTYLVKYRIDPRNTLTVELPTGRTELTPLELAMSSGDRWTTEALLKLADPRALERGLMYVVRNKHTRAVSFILAEDSKRRTAAGNAIVGATHEAISRDALTEAAGLAARIGHATALEALANHGADVNSGSPFPPICAAIEEGQIESLRVILAKGQATSSTRCADGLSPRGLAVRLGRTAAVSVLDAVDGQ